MGGPMFLIFAALYLMGVALAFVIWLEVEGDRIGVDCCAVLAFLWPISAGVLAWRWFTCR